ncbi:hypothetical protein EC973_007669 [Apophysomyces ossiformis]|uniref:Amidohydrolase-related domain-containing protein n=1 Tax=Apophysomyces ossiformis TaxID=679940 RepID=A0A8H7BXJ3_9FUNG|nr:hypothetical protein EC973_007669 [Apophysomyces ossiformis]
MSTPKQGYSAITVPDDGTNDHNVSNSTTEETPLTNTNGVDRIRDFDFRRYLRTRLAYILYILLGLILLIGFSIAFFLPEDEFPLPRGARLDRPIKPGIPFSALHEGLAKCKRIQTPRQQNIPDPNRVNPRSKGSQPILIKNAVVWDGQGEVLENVDILMEDGVIKSVESSIEHSAAKVIDVKGHIVGPGLVDMHSHLGLYAFPILLGNHDVNEETNPLTPYVRSLDAFNPSDMMVRVVAAGGVTTALVLPGSGNLMGGEAYAFKLRNISTNSNDDMLVQFGIDEEIESRQRYLKMACGENPKKVYGRFRGEMPMTRLGEAYLFRQGFADAQQLMHEQDDWCIAADTIVNGGSTARLETRFPEDLRLEPLVALLRGEALLNVHCYETRDMEAMIRHSNEFNFTIAAFHHALDAYRASDILKRARNNITIATFADNWGFKQEAFRGTPHAPKILVDAGIPVALKSDHPVLNSQHLIFEAAKANHYGLSQQEAFKTVTSVPAAALGLGHRIGSLRVGYDADIVIWDRSPLEIGASPLQVFVDGIPLLEDRPISAAVEKKKKSATIQSLSSTQLKDYEGARDFVLKNVGKIILDNTAIGNEDSNMVVVRDGKILCSGRECASSTDAAFLSGKQMPEIDVNGGYVIPGLIAAGSTLGLVEIPSEEATSDGTVSPSSSYDANAIVEAIDGIKLGTRHLEEAYKGGVLTAITAPISKNVVAGISVAFKTGAESLLADGAVVAPAVALHLQVGDSVKSTSFPTISSQIAFIRQIFSKNEHERNYYGQAVRGDIPTIVAVNNKDEIASIVRLKGVFPHARFVILGGGEAHLVAQHLADADIPVILSPSLCMPQSYESLHCLTGAPLTNGTAAHILYQHGVKVGLGVKNDGNARNLAWEASWLSATSPTYEVLKDAYIPEVAAIRFVTTNLQEIFGIHNTNGFHNNQDFVVWSGSPLELHSRPIIVYSASTGAHILP